MPRNPTTKYPILIIGSGPAGCATALKIAQVRPHLSRFILVIEKSRHPRPKVCGGGITARTDIALADIGAACNVPCVEINYARIVFDNRWIRLPAPAMMRVVGRDEFDACLASHLGDYGIALREDEAARELEFTSEGVVVRTAKGAYLARAVVGADGANGCSLRYFRRRAGSPWAAVTATVPRIADGFEPDEACVDFSCIGEGAQGYSWRFPCLVGGAPFVNYGICSLISAKDGRVDLQRILREWLHKKGVSIERGEFKGAFSWAYSPEFRLSRPHLLLAGDTAGIDELTGEGIGQSILYGKIAAQEIVSAFDRNDFSFRNYTQRVKNSEIGKELAMSAKLKRIHSPRAIEALMDRICADSTLGAALTGHMSGTRSILSNRHTFAGHAVSALGIKGFRLVKTILNTVSEIR